MLNICIVHVTWIYAAMAAGSSLKGDTTIIFIVLIGVEGS